MNHPGEPGGGAPSDEPARRGRGGGVRAKSGRRRVVPEDPENLDDFLRDLDQCYAPPVAPTQSAADHAEETTQKESADPAAKPTDLAQESLWLRELTESQRAAIVLVESVAPK